MSNITFLNVASWNKEQVANWLTGLDDLIQPYVGRFLQHGITGEKLLVLDHLDLDTLQVTKLGHQELILEAIDHLRQLQYSLDSENVQSIALKLCCQAKCVKSEMQAFLNHSQKENNEKLPLAVLSGVAFIQGHIKNLVSWLDRSPFDGWDEYTKKRNDMVKLGMDLITTVQGDNNVFTNHEDVISLCDTIVRRCESIVQESKDSLTIQPAWLEIATIRKKPSEELGMHIQSSYNGTHTIGGIKVESPADHCKKIGEGDEVIKVNDQTVIGWQLKKLVASLKENPKQVSLFLKRRPCHADPFGSSHRKKKANKLSAQAGTFPAMMKSRRSRKGRTPLEELISTTPVGTDTFRDSVKEVESESDTLADNDNVFRSGSESPGFQHLRAFDDTKQRRATVSGGSPTLKRPSIMISDSDTPRPKSYVLPLHSPTSDETYDFDFCLEVVSELKSSLKEGNTGTTVDVSQTTKQTVIPAEGKSATTYSSPLTSVSSADSVFVGRAGDKSGVDTTTDSSGLAMDSSTDASFDHVDGVETIPEEVASKDETGSVLMGPTTAHRPAISLSDPAEAVQKTSAAKEYKRTISHPTQTVNSNVIAKTALPTHRPTTDSQPAPATEVISSHPPPDTSNPRTVPQPPSQGSPVTPMVVASSHQRSDVTVSSRTVTLAAAPTQAPGSTEVKTSPERNIGSTDPGYQHYGGMGAVPKEITRLSPVRGESPRRRKASEQAAKVEAIAGGCEMHAPTLLKVSRIDSIMRAKISEEERRQRGEYSNPSPDSSPGRSSSSDDRPLSVLSTYSVNIVGGVPHVSRSNHLPKKNSSMTQSNQSLLRKKDGKTPRKRIFGANRRISCKDLGHGDCQGWLYKRREGSGLGSKWSKMWFVLKDKDMYYYKSPDDERAKGVLHLPGFQIKPAPEVKSKKYAFKAEHSGTTFFFASDRQDDMAKWMAKMGLSSIQYQASDSDVMAPFVKHDVRLGEIYENEHAAYSESEDEETPLGTPKSCSRDPSVEDLHRVQSDDNIEKVFTDIRRLADPIRNEDLQQKRVSHLGKPPQRLQLPNPAEIERLRKLSSLQRTLKDRERDLQAIEDVLSSDLSSATLAYFCKEQAALVKTLQKATDTVSQSSSSPSEDEAGAAQS